MGPGYVVAAVFETAGLIGLTVAASVMRAERQARVAELRSFLRSGQAALSASGSIVPTRWGWAAPRVIDVPVVTHRRDAGQPLDSAARSALTRAIRKPAPDTIAAITAG